MAHSGSPSATSISRSRRFFSFVQGVGRCDPPLRPHPAYPQKAREGGAYGLPRDPPFGETRLEGRIGGHLQSPQATLIPELPRRAVEHAPQGFGASLVEGRVPALGGRGAFDQSVQTLLVEGADGVSDRLRGAPEVLGYLGWREAAGARQKDLAATHHEGLPGAQPRFEVFSLLFRQFPDEYWRFHGRNYSPSHTTLSEDELVAALHGPVYGAGVGIALACDLRIVAENTMFSVAFIKIGLMPDAGVTFLLPRVVGLG